MSPVTHFLGSWLIAAVTTDNPRDRKLVTLAGILPDADALGIVADTATALGAGKASDFNFYQKYHHLLLHGWPGALVVTAGLVCFARQRFRVGLLCLIVFHLHLLCDFIGSRGPDPGDLWPICYSEPLFRHPIWFWKGQWRLDGWQNGLVSVLAFAGCLVFAAERGCSFIEIFSRRLDSHFVRVLQKWRAAFVSRSNSN